MVAGMHNVRGQWGVVEAGMPIDLEAYTGERYLLVVYTGAGSDRNEGSVREQLKELGFDLDPGEGPAQRVRGDAHSTKEGLRGGGPPPGAEAPTREPDPESHDDLQRELEQEAGWAARGLDEA